MYKYYPILVILFFALPIKAQQTTVSPSFKQESTNSIHIIGKCLGNYYCLVNNDSAYTIMEFDKDLQIKISTTLPVSNKFLFDTIWLKENTINFLYTATKLPHKSLLQFNLKNNTVLSNTLIWEAKDRDDEINFELSENKMYLMLWQQIEKSGNDSIYCKVYNSDATLINISSFQLPYPTKVMNNTGFVFNDGSICFSTSLQNAYGNVKEFKFTQLNSAGIDTVSIQLLKGDHSNFLSFANNKINQLEIYYWQQNTERSQTDSLYRISYSVANKKVQALQARPINYLQLKAIQREDLGNYKLRTVIPQSNDATLIVAEQDYSSETILSSDLGPNIMGGVTNTRIIKKRTFGNILILPFTEQTSAFAQVALLKLQELEDGEIAYGSYRLIKQREKLNFIYFDLNGTYELKNISLDNFFNIRYERLSIAREAGERYQISLGKQVGANDFLLPVLEGKKQGVALIKL